MPTDADLWTGTVCHCALAVVVKAFTEVSEKRAATDGRLPCCLVHGELLEVFQIDDDGIVYATSDG